MVCSLGSSCVFLFLFNIFASFLFYLWSRNWNLILKKKVLSFLYVLVLFVLFSKCKRQQFPVSKFFSFLMNKKTIFLWNFYCLHSAVTSIDLFKTTLYLCCRFWKLLWNFKNIFVHILFHFFFFWFIWEALRRSFDGFS